MIRKLASGRYRPYSLKTDPKPWKWKNLGTFDTREKAPKHERAIQFFKRGGDPCLSPGAPVPSVGPTAPQFRGMLRAKS